MKHGYCAGLRDIELLANIYRHCVLRHNDAGMDNAQLVRVDGRICAKKYIGGNLRVEDQPVKLAI
jgi:hypothetical protein